MSTYCVRCVPQKCVLGEKFNAFYGRCEKIQCPIGYNVTSIGKCVGKKMNLNEFLHWEMKFYFSDINECAQNPCKFGERCDNTPGSYRCVQIFTCANGLEMKNSQCLGSIDWL